jgi:hypothetical protein
MRSGKVNPRAYLHLVTKLVVLPMQVAESAPERRLGRDDGARVVDPRVQLVEDGLRVRSTAKMGECAAIDLLEHVAAGPTAARRAHASDRRPRVARRDRDASTETALRRRARAARRASVPCAPPAGVARLPRLVRPLPP